jgi:protease IV
MPGFFKTFFASLLALIVFCLLGILFAVIVVGGFTKKPKPRLMAKTVLVLDLNQHFKEQVQTDPLALFSTGETGDVPGLYDLVRIIRKASADKNVSGIFLKANNNLNGFGASAEIRNALLDFKKSKKFLIAHADILTQRAYSIANVCDKVYLAPQGAMEWRGFSVDLAFVKGTLEKLEIEPQIFYAGKFKSATEPFRGEQMTPENRLQTTEWMNDLYDDFLIKTSESRKIDTARLRQIANEGLIQRPKDAWESNLVDGLKYDDEIKEEIRTRLKLDSLQRINFLSVNQYLKTGRFLETGKDQIALIYAEGNIVDGKSEDGVISSEHYRNLIRSARLDKNVKAIVFRVNSGGGSSLASENIWRELALAKKAKPVVVSFGDVAASGGYYISCAADSIFAQPTTITGSIGVFGIIPNMQAFFKNKLGITFDGVKTGPYADAGSPMRPMTDTEKQMVQEEVNRIYALFKERVADGRKKDTAYVDGIAQGRVWTGKRAMDIGLIDRFGGLQDAVDCAARMAKTSSYRLLEYPEPFNFLDRLLGKKNPFDLENKVKDEMGEKNYRLYSELKRVKEMCNTVQARIPFQFFIR